MDVNQTRTASRLTNRPRGGFSGPLPQCDERPHLRAAALGAGALYTPRVRNEYKAATRRTARPKFAQRVRLACRTLHRKTLVTRHDAGSLKRTGHAAQMHRGAGPRHRFALGPQHPPKPRGKQDQCDARQRHQNSPPPRTARESAQRHLALGGQYRSIIYYSGVRHTAVWTLLSEIMRKTRLCADYIRMRCGSAQWEGGPIRFSQFRTHDRATY